MSEITVNGHPLFYDHDLYGWCYIHDGVRRLFITDERLYHKSF